MRGMPIPLMLATLTDRRDFDDGWLLERKLDGERCVAVRDGATVWLESRTGQDLTSRYPEITAALAAQRAADFVLDGEVVAFDGDRTSFGRLQQRIGQASPGPELLAAYPVVYCLFDILELAGETGPARHALDPAGAGRAGRLRGVDRRRPPPPAPVPRPARRQAAGRGRARTA
jgi:ATP-dependent DNA ligase